MDDIVVGGIGYAQRAMRRLGFVVPVLESVPAHLAAFAGRPGWVLERDRPRNQSGVQPIGLVDEVRLLLGMRVRDTQTGLRGIPTALLPLKSMLSFYVGGMGSRKRTACMKL